MHKFVNPRSDTNMKIRSGWCMSKCLFLTLVVLVFLEVKVSAVDIPEAVKKKMSELTSRRSQNRKEMDEKRRNAKQEIDLVKQRSPAASGAGNKRKNSKDIMNEEDSVTTADDASKSAKETMIPPSLQ